MAAAQGLGNLAVSGLTGGLANAIQFGVQSDVLIGSGANKMAGNAMNLQGQAITSTASP